MVLCAGEGRNSLDRWVKRGQKQATKKSNT
nr:MAG TPA: hypothetical protein [Caudoviricetes sp.]